jgi:hypothetical protein
VKDGQRPYLKERDATANDEEAEYYRHDIDWKARKSDVGRHDRRFDAPAEAANPWFRMTEVTRVAPVKMT